MLPETGNILTQDFTVTQQPSKTCRLDMDEKRICGQADGLEAVRQAVYCILNTERYEWLVYSWNYGVELKDLAGMEKRLARSKIKKRISEALTQDDRIGSVDAFSFDERENRVYVTFTVHTVFGDTEADKEVKV